MRGEKKAKEKEEEVIDYLKTLLFINNQKLKTAKRGAMSIYYLRTAESSSGKK